MPQSISPPVSRNSSFTINPLCFYICINNVMYKTAVIMYHLHSSYGRYVRCPSHAASHSENINHEHYIKLYKNINRRDISVTAWTAKFSLYGHHSKNRPQEQTVNMKSITTTDVISNVKNKTSVSTLQTALCQLFFHPLPYCHPTRGHK